MHAYRRDPQSGAGNCVYCGWPERAQHHPHGFMAAMGQYVLCTCGLPLLSQPHKLPGS